ncbi:MAG: hypothetical protein ACFFAK_04525 [Promethearchaeota archaeon]
MKNEELFHKQIYELVSELKIPLIDERVHNNVKINSSPVISKVKFTYEEDEKIIRGFLGLAEYFHTVVIKDDDKYYIPHDKILFMLES